MSDEEIRAFENCDKKRYQQFNYAKKKRALQHRIIKKVEKLPALWNDDEGKIHSPISRGLYASIVKEINKEWGIRLKCKKNQLFFTSNYLFVLKNMDLSAMNELDIKKI